MARNVLRGGGKAYKQSVTGLKELERKLKAVSKDNPAMKAEMREIVAGAAKEMRDEMVRQARAAGWGNERVIGSRGARRGLARINARIRTGDGGFAPGGVSGQMAINSIFSYGKPRSGDFKKIDALAGVTKPETMVEWTAGKHPKSGRAKVSAGGKVAMAFATMLEFGTSRMRARPAIRPAVKAAQARIIARVTGGLNGMMEKFAK